jgi:hypothetical protein
MTWRTSSSRQKALWLCSFQCGRDQDSGLLVCTAHEQIPYREDDQCKVHRFEENIITDHGWNVTVGMKKTDVFTGV